VIGMGGKRLPGGISGEIMFGECMGWRKIRLDCEVRARRWVDG